MKMNYSEINLKAAAITGAVLGFLAWFVMVPWYLNAGYGAYGMMGYMMGLGYAYASSALLSAIVTAICGAIAGAAIAIVYNWSLKLK